MKNREGFSDVVFGVSPRGGNSVVGDEIQGVPLFYDQETDSYVSEQAIEEAQDRKTTRQRRLIAQEEEAFRAKVGFKP